ncbi:Hypothetical protein A7982_00622 [Minicystis rosea]|nr:Hypothetical protein A7982_00622 [Minicystis rosea]
MEWQWLTEGKLVDLNCGRYCATAAIRWWLPDLKKLGIDYQGDIFHSLLPEPTLKFGLLRWAWTPAVEGRGLFWSVRKPTSLEEWDAWLSAYGPLVVAGKLGLADWGSIFRGVDHFILIVGVDVQKGLIVYKDPLRKHDVERVYKFADFQDRVSDPVFAVDFRALTDKVLEAMASAS